jgi:hypothetical protein
MAVISDKPNLVTPAQPFHNKNSKKDEKIPVNDDVVDRAFRLEAMRR